MSLVPYDVDFDKKVELGAEALMKYRNTPPEQLDAERPKALQEARMVLLGAMSIKNHQ
jgi:hypothetical protein